MPTGVYTRKPRPVRPALAVVMNHDGSVSIPLQARDGSIRAYVTIDVADAEWVNQWQWRLHSYGYAVRGERGKVTILMHRVILGLLSGDLREVDHINLNRLDNRRCNLRILPRGGNAQNQPSRPGTSTHRGVSWSKSTGKWQACVRANGHQNHLGFFAEEAEAAAAARAGRARLLPYTVD